MRNVLWINHFRVVKKEIFFSLTTFQKAIIFLYRYNNAQFRVLRYLSGRWSSPSLSREIPGVVSIIPRFSMISGISLELGVFVVSSGLIGVVFPSIGIPAIGFSLRGIKVSRV